MTQGTWRYVHKAAVDQYDTQGNRHQVQYQQNAEARQVRYVHLPTCWCKIPAKDSERE